MHAHSTTSMNLPWNTADGGSFELSHAVCWVHETVCRMSWSRMQGDAPAQMAITQAACSAHGGKRQMLCNSKYVLECALHAHPHAL